MSERLNSVREHVRAVGSRSGVGEQRPDDVVILAANRSAIGRAFKGGFKDTDTAHLVQQFVLEFKKQWPEELQKRAELLGEVCCGNVLNGGAGATEHRAACLAAGVPHSVPFIAVNRQCSSGLMAANDIANRIRCGEIDVGLALGVESMSKHYGKQTAESTVSALADLRKDQRARSCLVPMGITNENVAHRFGVSREEQDAFAAESYGRADRARRDGLFEDEILKIANAQGELVAQDEGPRSGVTAQSLAKLKPAFRADGTTHAGNASQVSDGVAGVLLARRAAAQRLFPNHKVLGRLVACRTVGVEPEIMGVGPAAAIPKVLEATGLRIADVDVFEINEAFAAQALYCVRELGIDRAKVNPRGGAIALGHPLGCTGARQIATILRELPSNGIGVVSMCIGTGMGAAAVLVRE